MKTRALRSALCALLLASCARAPVMDELTIEPSRDDDSVRVSVATSFTLQPANDAVRARVESARAAALSATDPWSIRFARLDAEEDSVTYARSRGTLERLTRSAVIRSNDLQQVFSDANITATLMRGPGWGELTFYPGSGGRATRDQQRRFDSELSRWSEDVARYFVAIDHLYAYLRTAPERDRYLFAALLSEKGIDGADPVVMQEEQPLVEAVIASMERIGGRMDEQEDRAATFAEEADLIFNPFPARVTVRAPGDVLSSEGFTVRKGNELIIEPVDLFSAIAGLEGKWISPDPLAALLREQAPTAAQLAEAPRKSQAVVSSTEVARAIREELVRPRTYSVKWRA